MNVCPSLKKMDYTVEDNRCNRLKIDHCNNLSKPSAYFIQLSLSHNVFVFLIFKKHRSTFIRQNKIQKKSFL